MTLKCPTTRSKREEFKLVSLKDYLKDKNPSDLISDLLLGEDEEEDLTIPFLRNNDFYFDRSSQQRVS